MSAEEQRVRRFAVLSHIVVLVVGIALLVGGALALSSGRTALGIVLIVVAALLVIARGVWTAVRGMRKVRDSRESAQVPDAPVLGAGTASPVDRVLADLVGMNSDALPYRIDATQSGDDVQVEVRWKSEELRWKTLFVRGRVAYTWRMELTLDAANARYRFVEYSGTASTSAGFGPGGVSSRSDWKWKRGKTAFQTSASFREGADGQIVIADANGPRTSWEGATIIRPADAKKPVFTVLRNHGWRPRIDWAGARVVD